MSGTRVISTTSRRGLSSSSCQNGVNFLRQETPKEIHAILTETLACFLLGRAKNLSAPLYKQRQESGRSITTVLCSDFVWFKFNYSREFAPWDCLIIKIEAPWSSEISGSICQSTWHNILEDVTYLTLWRRNDIFFFILAHSVYKIWIIQEPNKLELWNKLHFEEKKTESIHHV